MTETREGFWEYLRHFHKHLRDKYGMEDMEILIPKVLEGVFLEKCPGGIMALDGHEVPIRVSRGILVEEDQDNCIATEVWIGEKF